METKEINENRGNIIKISKKKFIIKFTIMFLIIFLSFIYIVNTYATTEKSPLLVNKFKKAFEKNSGIFNFNSYTSSRGRNLYRIINEKI